MAAAAVAAAAGAAFLALCASASPSSGSASLASPARASGASFKSTWLSSALLASPEAEAASDAVFLRAEAADAAEWGGFFEEVERARRERREPETPWLKTCAGFIAQEMCSTVFGSGLSEETAWEEDLGRLGEIGGTYEIDYEERTVTGRCSINNPNNSTYKSIFRDGIGCTLVEQLTEAEIRAQNLGNVGPPPPLDPNVAWPVGEGFFPEQAPPEVDLDCLARVSADQFANEPANPRALVVVYKGQLVFEQYAEGVTKDNRLLGWSATKSLTQSMIGILSGEGRVNIYEPAPVTEWYETPSDPRQNITIDMMLRMSSGTVWNGDLGPTTQCIFWSDNDCPHVCALKPLEAEPDTLWNYNSGSTYILSRVVMERRGEPELTNWEWPKQKFFYPIGAHSMYIEYQPNGNFLGGAYGYATARDWARYGLLQQRRGVWVDGRRILPEGWAEYSGTPTPTNPDEYASHHWRNGRCVQPRVDARLYYASGFRNQNVYIFPDQEIVIARLAMPAFARVAAFRPTRFLLEALSCFSNATAAAY